MLSMQSLMQEARLPGRRSSRKRAGENERKRISEAIDALPEISRLVLGLRYYESVRPKQIASILDLSVEEVRELLTEAARTVVTELQLEESAPIVEKSRRTTRSATTRRNGRSR